MLRIATGAFIFVFGILHLYSGIWLKKVTLIGWPAGYSDTYYGRGALVQGVLAFCIIALIALFFIFVEKIFIYSILLPLILSILFHFIFPPKR
jgi:hypothetical protein